MSKKLFLFIVLIFSIAASRVYAQQPEIVPDQKVTTKAQVLDVLSQNRETLPGLDVQGDHQMLMVKILEGEETGKIVKVENTYINLAQGDNFYLTHIVDKLDGVDAYNVEGPDRITGLLVFLGIFVMSIFLLGGKQGIRGLISLILSFALIVFVLLPGIMHGYPPVLVSIGVAALIIVLGSYITHGFNKTTTAAVAGMLVTMAITGLLALIAIRATHLTGFSSEESTYLNFNTGGHLDMAGVLLGGILIGLLGILYDAAIGQAVAIEELHQVGPHLSRWMIYRRATRIGREHVGALVNTLAIAYVGISLPLLLLYTYSQQSLVVTINQEMFSTEIVRILVGSIGLVIAIPVTNLVATWILVKQKRNANEQMVAKEQAAVEKMEHTH